MKAAVDKELCIGCGLCEAICPEVFRLGDEGVAEVLVDEIPDELAHSAKDAAEQCPVGAILLEE